MLDYADVLHNVQAVQPEPLPVAASECCYSNDGDAGESCEQQVLRYIMC